MEIFQRSDRGMRTLLVAAAFVVVVAGLRAAQSVFVPVLSSALVAVLFLPAMLWLQRRRVPDWAALTIVFLAVLGLFALLTLGVGKSISDFNEQLPSYGAKLQDRMGGLVVHLNELLRPTGFEVSRSTILEHVRPDLLLDYFGSVAGAAADLLSNTMFVLLTIAFILAEAASFPRKLQEAFGGAEVVSGPSAGALASVREYLRIKLLVSLATGALAMLLVRIVGVDFPVLWGVLAFLLNFVPTIGSIVAGVPPVLLAVVQLGWAEAAWTLAGYTAINGVIGNVIEPRLMGRKLGLSSLVVWLSLVFWGWVWGPLGMLLSVPLTMLVKLLLERSDDLRWVAVLLGPGGENLKPAAPPPPRAADDSGPA